MARTCRDCFHMRARIPLDHLEEFGTTTRHKMAYSRLCYEYATAYCRQGHLDRQRGDLSPHGPGPRIFNIGAGKWRLSYKAWEKTEKCGDFEGA